MSFFPLLQRLNLHIHDLMRFVSDWLADNAPPFAKNSPIFVLFLGYDKIAVFYASI
ncbi:MAG: hypothetical protein FWG65_13225 [Turicibacter sp.]|nr:hypothetical protein [Turicibacter sp.]